MSTGSIAATEVQYSKCRSHPSHPDHPRAPRARERVAGQEGANEGERTKEEKNDWHVYVFCCALGIYAHVGLSRDAWYRWLKRLASLCAARTRACARSYIHTCTQRVARECAVGAWSQETSTNARGIRTHAHVNAARVRPRVACTHTSMRERMLHVCTHACGHALVRGMRRTRECALRSRTVVGHATWRPSREYAAFSRECPHEFAVPISPSVEPTPSASLARKDLLDPSVPLILRILRRGAHPASHLLVNARV